jgi:hypothetical protein
VGTTFPVPSLAPEAAPLGLRRPTLAVLAVALQAAPGLPGGHLVDLRDGLLVASAIAITAWFALNLRAARGALRVALGVALAGGLLNLAVMLPNGGMPVAPEALAEIGGAGVDVTDGHLYKHLLIDDGTVLAFLGDVIPVRPLGMAASVGDGVLLAGLLATAAVLVRRHART